MFCEPFVSEFNVLESLGTQLWHNSHPAVLKGWRAWESAKFQQECYISFIQKETNRDREWLIPICNAFLRGIGVKHAALCDTCSDVRCWDEEMELVTSPFGKAV